MGIAKNKYMKLSLLEFQKKFTNEKECVKHFIKQRWSEGFECPDCSNSTYWYIEKRKILDCKKCRKKISLTAGTIFEKTRTPLLKWYWLIYYMAMHKVGISIYQMQKLLEIKDYKTIWLMSHKIRMAMLKRDSKYKISGLIELDDSLFGPPGTTRGRGSKNKCIVLCAVSLYKNKNNEERPRFANMAVVSDASADSVQKYLEEIGFDKSSDEVKQLIETIRTDGWKSYSYTAEQTKIKHCRIIINNPKDAGKLLPWVHRITANTKMVLSGAHHGVSNKHLQLYLSEVCFKFNRRFWEKELFERLLHACIVTNTMTYNELIME